MQYVSSFRIAMVVTVTTVAIAEIRKNIELTKFQFTNANT